MTGELSIQNEAETLQEGFRYDRTPLLVYWEATQACDLACMHCRAEAVSHRHPLELSTEEAKLLLRQITEFGEERRPHLVITGGDPLQRPDLFELIAYGRELGLNISVTPAGTPRLTPEVVQQLKVAGISSLALSLDGSDASKHDTFRGVPGSFRWTVEAARATRSAGIALQVNTMVTPRTLDDLPQTYQVVQELDIARWALFFLIPMGRGQKLLEVTPVESERLLNWLCDLVESSDTHFAIKTTEAHHFRRIYYQRLRARGIEEKTVLKTPIGRGFGVRDGNGIVFVSHFGEVYPSGFLPLSAGNIHQQNLVEIYRHNGLFRALRDADRFKGKCGRCPFRAACGGSRARAYATTGDLLESDPLCVYQPPSNG